MSNPKRIEELEEVIDLQNNDLVFASVLNSRGTYDSKKVTLENIANYVRNGMEPGGSGSGSGSGSSSYGYEMYDTSEDTDGTYDSITQYQQSENNYAWYLPVGAGQTLTKRVTKDCVVWIDGVGGQDDSSYGWGFYINNVQINTFLFRNNSGERAIYVKQGQELKLETQTYTIKLSVIPLASGGQFFIDTSIAPEQGTLTQNFTYEATRPTLFAHNYGPNVSQTTSAKINGKNVVPMEHAGQANLCTYYILKTRDILTTISSSNVDAEYAAYALLTD